MSVTISPLTILGRWQAGFALDYHIVSSTHIGDDEFGHPRFETKRTSLGELVYRLKNGADTSVTPDIVEAAVQFLKRWSPPVSGVIPVPPSNARRRVQPVPLIGKALAGTLDFEWLGGTVSKIRATPQLKDVLDLDKRTALLTGAFAADKERFKGKSVLLFDDLYRSGATMNSIADVLYDQAEVSAVYALTLTRTKVKR